MILIMTASVSPAKIRQLSLRDVDERLKQYCSALQFYIRSKRFDKIVFCDNSNYDYEYLLEKKLAEEKGVLLEILKFTSEYNLVEKYGKGYGEGEILKYVLSNSYLLQTEEYFYKVTGRLIVKNISKLVKKKETCTRFNRNLYANKSVDTRFWGMAKQQFTQYLIDSYKKVNDENGIYIEKCYKIDLEKNRIDYKPFRCFPNICGFSGTIGKEYKETNWYTRFLYNMLCFAQIYNTEFGFGVVVLAYNVIIRKKEFTETYCDYLLNNME